MITKIVEKLLEGETVSTADSHYTFQDALIRINDDSELSDEYEEELRKLANGEENRAGEIMTEVCYELAEEIEDDVAIHEHKNEQDAYGDYLYECRRDAAGEH